MSSTTPPSRCTLPPVQLAAALAAGPGRLRLSWEAEKGWLSLTLATAEAAVEAALSPCLPPPRRVGGLLQLTVALPLAVSSSSSASAATAAAAAALA